MSIVSGRDRIEHERRGGKGNKMEKIHNLWSEGCDSQLRMILPPKRYLAMVITTGDDAASIYWVDNRDAAKHLAIYKTTLYHKELSGPKHEYCQG